jgi:hypothetical protein
MILIDEQETHEKETYTYFKRLYNKELRLLYVSQNPRKTKARAFEATAMGDWKSSVEHNLNQVNMGQEELASILTAAIRDNLSISGETHTHPAGSISIPSVITAGSSLTNDRYRQMEDKLLNAINTAQQSKSQTTYEQRPHSNSYEQRPKIWRQYKCWCYSCGVNLSQNSNECRSLKNSSGVEYSATTSKMGIKR